MPTELERLIEYRKIANRSDALEVVRIESPLVRLTVADVEVVAPPTDLVDSIAWHDRQADWAYRRSGTASIEAYLAWRATWESSHTLGRIGMLRQLRASLREAGVTLSEPAERAMELLLRGDITDDGARLTIGELEALDESVRELAALVRAPGSIGVALVDASPTSTRTGLLRAWTANPIEPEISSRGAVTVRFAGSRLGVWFADDRDDIDDVRSFEFTIDGAVVVDADGAAHVLDADATDAICAIAPETTAWRVRRVPEVLVWAELLGSLESALDAARASGATPRIRLGDERQVALTSID